jgi:hypothetical protein
MGLVATVASRLPRPTKPPWLVQPKQESSRCGHHSDGPEVQPLRNSGVGGYAEADALLSGCGFFFNPHWHQWRRHCADAAIFDAFQLDD